MTLFTEHEVAVVASFMGYDLWRGAEGGYFLKRERNRKQEIIKASSLELIADFSWWSTAD